MNEGGVPLDDEAVDTARVKLMTSAIESERIRKLQTGPTLGWKGSLPVPRYR
jgi:hypothetical protein